MVDNDQAPSIARDQYIHTHTISFASNIKFMEDMANAGGDYYTADNEETLVNALISLPKLPWPPPPLCCGRCVRQSV